MAGPGGGSSGGGFGGGSFGGSHGGSFGGSHHGGSFGGGHHGGFGGHHGHFHGPHWRMGGYGPRVVVGGGGCFTGFFIFIFLFFFAAFAFLPSQMSIDMEDGSVMIYSESGMQKYANEKYNEYFGDSSAYEDNILLVFLSNEEADGYYTIAWVGDNVNYDINTMFGEYTEYGDAMSQYINRSYFGFSLDTDYAMVIDYMAKRIDALGLSSSFNSESDRSNLARSEFVNLTGFELSADIVNKALAGFTAKTGIPCVVVVDYAEKVFASEENYSEKLEMIEKVTKSQYILYIPVLIIGVFVIAICIMIFRKKRKAGKQQNSNWHNQGNNENKPPWES